MNFPTLNLIVLPGSYSIVRLPRDAELPEWAHKNEPGSLRSITHSNDELSIVLPARQIADVANCRRSDGWRCLRFDGTFDLNTTGILASVVGPLADAKFSVFALATFDTDYVLVRETQLDGVRRVLHAAGHTIRDQ